MDCAFTIISQKSLPSPNSQKFYLIFTSRSFIVLGLTFTAIIHFEIIFVYGVR